MASRAKLTLVPKDEPAPKKEVEKQDAETYASKQPQTTSCFCSSKLLKTTAFVGLTIASLLLFRRKIF